MMRFPYLIVAIVLFLQPESRGQSCTAWEAKKSIDGQIMTFRLPPYPWKVTADTDGNLTIENSVQKSVCKTKLESTISVFVGKGDLIYVRSAEIARDELFTLDGRSCKDARAVRKLDSTSEARTNRLLRTLHICPRP